MAFTLQSSFSSWLYCLKKTIVALKNKNKKNMFYLMFGYHCLRRSFRLQLCMAERRSWEGQKNMLSQTQATRWLCLFRDVISNKLYQDILSYLSLFKVFPLLSILICTHPHHHFHPTLSGEKNWSSCTTSCQPDGKSLYF